MVVGFGLCVLWFVGFGLCGFCGWFLLVSVCFVVVGFGSVCFVVRGFWFCMWVLWLVFAICVFCGCGFWFCVFFCFECILRKLITYRI